MKIIYFLAISLMITIGATVQYIHQQLTTSTPEHTLPVHGLRYTPESIIANGVVEGASLEVNLLPEMVGRITKVRVREQQQVDGGTVLVELDNAVQKYQYALAAAELAHAKANLEKIRNGERKEKRQAVAAEETARRVQLQHARAEYERIRQLMARNATNRSEYDLHRFKMLEAEAMWSQSKAELDLIVAPARSEDIALAEAEVEAAKARLNQAQAELDKTILKAPFGGQVLRIYAEPGELVSPQSSSAILTFADLSKRRVRAFVEELDSTRVMVGQPAKVTADALPGMEYAGKVVQVFPRMGKQRPRSNAPGEYNDIYFREVLIELETQADIPINLRVEVCVLTNVTEFTDPSVAWKAD